MQIGRRILEMHEETAKYHERHNCKWSKNYAVLEKKRERKRDIIYNLIKHNKYGLKIDANLDFQSGSYDESGYLSYQTDGEAHEHVQSESFTFGKLIAHVIHHNGVDERSHQLNWEIGQLVR